MRRERRLASTVDRAVMKSQHCPVEFLLLLLLLFLLFISLSLSFSPEELRRRDRCRLTKKDFWAIFKIYGGRCLLLL